MDSEFSFEEFYSYVESDPELKRSAFDSTALFLIADLYYRHYRHYTFGDRLKPEIGNPEQTVKRPHELCLELTKQAIQPHAHVFGDKKWEELWSYLSKVLSLEAEALIGIAEKHKEEGQGENRP